MIIDKILEEVRSMENKSERLKILLEMYEEQGGVEKSEEMPVLKAKEWKPGIRQEAVEMLEAIKQGATKEYKAKIGGHEVNVNEVWIGKEQPFNDNM